MNAYFLRQLADYVKYHRDPWNCAMHVFGIVFLFLAAVLPVCTENLNTGVVVMKSAQDGA